MFFIDLLTMLQQDYQKDDIFVEMENQQYSAFPICRDLILNQTLWESDLWWIAGC